MLLLTLLAFILSIAPCHSKLRSTNSNTNLILNLDAREIKNGAFVQLRVKNDVLIDGYKIFAKNMLGSAIIESLDKDLLRSSCRLKLNGAKINDSYNNVHYLKLDTIYLDDCKSFDRKAVLANDLSPMIILAEDDEELSRRIVRKNVSWDLK